MLIDLLQTPSIEYREYLQEEKKVYTKLQGNIRFYLRSPDILEGEYFARVGGDLTAKFYHKQISTILKNRFGNDQSIVGYIVKRKEPIPYEPIAHKIYFSPVKVSATRPPMQSVVPPKNIFALPDESFFALFPYLNPNS